MNFKNIILSERSQSQETTYDMIPFIENTQNRRIYRNRQYITGCLGLGGWERKWELKGMGFLFKVIKCSEIDGGMVAHHCEYYKNHRIEHFKWANYMKCELRINKVVIFS